MSEGKEVLVGNYKRVELGDHDMAAWLRKQDKNWTYQGFDHPPGTYFYAHGEVVAIIFYNNQACTKKIYIRKDLEI